VTPRDILNIAGDNYKGHEYGEDIHEGMPLFPATGDAAVEFMWTA
jgi:hypothetical protein